MCMKEFYINLVSVTQTVNEDKIFVNVWDMKTSFKPRDRVGEEREVKLICKIWRLEPSTMVTSSPPFVGV